MPKINIFYFIIIHFKPTIELTHFISVIILQITQFYTSYQLTHFYQLQINTFYSSYNKTKFIPAQNILYFCLPGSKLHVPQFIPASTISYHQLALIQYKPTLKLTYVISAAKLIHCIPAIKITRFVLAKTWYGWNRFKINTLISNPKINTIDIRSQINTNDTKMLYLM